MSRVASNPIVPPKGVEITVSGQQVQVKGSKGDMSLAVHESVAIMQEDSQLTFAGKKEGDKQADAMAGTMRALINNMVTGVSAGHERRLQLQGVGYRAQAQGKKVNLQLGFSHPIEYNLPEGVEAVTPSQTEIIISGADKQLIGQVCAEIRAFRPPEPYKGKGVRYADEHVRRKEAKKK